MVSGLSFARDLGRPKKSPLLAGTSDILQHHDWFSRQMTSEKQALEFHTDDALLPRSG